MIFIETHYKTHDLELLAIVETLNTWRHYLKAFKHEVFILTDNNKFYWFIDMKSLSFKQVQWLQELSKYYFQLDYWQKKTSATADILLWFPQRN